MVKEVAARKLLIIYEMLQSDWQPDMTSVSTSEQANNIDDKTANDANTEVITL